MTAAPSDPAIVADLRGASPAADADASADPSCFVFGGVAFDVNPSQDVAWQLGDEHRLFRSPYETDPVFARVHCVLAAAPELDAQTGREIHWRWDDDVAVVRTPGVRAELRELSPGAYVATGLVAPGSRGCSNFVTALTGALADRVGGLVLHASGIEVAGGAVLFIGPSGAGKTTAANHCDGATWFARDRAVVYPTAAGWYATAMCGGDPIELSRSEHSTLPLRAILRVRRGDARAELRDLGAVEALAVLRESVQATDRDVERERRAVEGILRVQAETRVGELRSVLGQDLTATLRAWVSA